MKKFWRWISSNWQLLFVVLFGGFLRFYRLRELTTFGGDQGIDYQFVAQMILTQKLHLLGPITHVGIYLGPLYYYVLIPFFLLFRFDPIAAPFFFALVGTLTVGLVYVLVRMLLRSDLSARLPASPEFQRGEPARQVRQGRTFADLFAFLAALLYAVSPVILESSRAPSQPHLVPFFATLLLISIIRIIEKKDKWWDWAAIGISLGSAIQFHFLTFPLWIFVLTIMAYKGLTFAYAKVRPCQILLRFVCLMTPMIILLFPWFLFELRNNFFISRQILAFLGTGEINASPLAMPVRFLDLSWFSISRLLAIDSQFLTVGVLVCIVAGTILLWKNNLYKLLFAYTVLNLFGIALYKNPFSNHYISAVYPSIVIIASAGIISVFPKRVAALMLILFIIINLVRYDPFRNHGYTMPEELTTSAIEQISETIANDAGTARFEIASTLDGDTRAQPYRYVLLAAHRRPAMPVDAYPDAEVLYVVAKNNSQEVLRNPVWEISSFGPARTARQWQITDSIYLYRLERGANI